MCTRVFWGHSGVSVNKYQFIFSHWHMTFIGTSFHMYVYSKSGWCRDHFSPCCVLIDASLWWSDMIDSSCLSLRQVVFIYLPRLPLLLDYSLFLSHLLGEFLEMGGFQCSDDSFWFTGTRLSLISSLVKLCCENWLTFNISEWRKPHVSCSSDGRPTSKNGKLSVGLFLVVFRHVSKVLIWTLQLCTVVCVI